MPTAFPPRRQHHLLPIHHQRHRQEAQAHRLRRCLPRGSGGSVSSSAAEPVTRTNPSTAAQRISAGEEGASQPGGVWQQDLAGNSLRRGPVDLLSLSQSHEGHRRHHRSRAGAQDPHAPCEDREASPRSGSHLPPLIAPPLRPGGSLSPLLHRNATEPAGGGPRPAARPDTPLLDAFGR